MELRCRREQESRAHQRQASLSAATEAEWKRERKMWKKVVRRLREKLEEKEEMICEMEEEMVATNEEEKKWESPGQLFLLGQMKEQQAQREEAVEKWKRLYLAIKTELDNLICRTYQGEGLWWGAEEENMMAGLQKELKDKEDTVETLKAQISAMENEEAKREREVDILRQSLRIMSNSKRGNVKKSLSRSLHL